MKKKVQFLKKNTLTKTLILGILIIMVPSIYGSDRGKEKEEIYPKIQLTEKYTGKVERTSGLANNEYLDFSGNSQEALKWSNQNFPKSEEDIKVIKEINEQLRTKYMNRSELYGNYEELEKIDSIFITSATEDIVLYANFTAEDFGINTQNFIEDNEKTFNTMLKNSEYGIDYGYFLGDLTPRSLDSEKNEVIQMKLTVPVGTKLVRVGSINDSKFILERGSTLQYTGKEVLENNNRRPIVNISAELITKKQLDLETELYNDAMNDMLENEFKLASPLIKLEPIGLNAGLVLSQGENVARKALENLRQENLLETEGVDGWSVFFTNGWLVHTTIFTIETEGMNVEQRRVAFNHYFNADASGTTLKLDGGKARTSINFNQLDHSNILKENRLIEHFGSITLHEYFHFLVNKNDSFKNRKMFKETSFKESVKELKELELDTLTDILNDGYAGDEDYEEYISEAFRAKLHPYQLIAERSAKEMLWTNRFLINIFDISPPTIPQNLKELDAKGNSVKFTFDHSSDNISVQKYNVYKNGDFVSSYDTDEDENGFSSPNPGENQENIEVEIDGLEQVTEYDFQVSAVDEAGNESEKSNSLKIKTKDTEPPELGGNLKGSALGSTLARFNWPRPTDNVGVSEAKIRRIESSSVLEFNFLPKAEETFTVSGDVNFFTDVTIAKGKTYTYSMTALDAAGNESERSNNVVIQTSDDDDRKRNEDKAENTSSSSSTLNWSGSFDGVSASGFQLFSWFKGLGGWIFGGMIPVSGSDSSADVSLTAGLLHMFVVIPVDKEGNPLQEGLEISVEALPNPVEGLRITDTKRTQISLEWENTNSNEEFKENLYHDIYRNSTLVATVDGSVTYYTDTALTPGTVYDYYVVARIGEDNQAEKSLTVSGKTLAPYHEQMIRIESTLFPDEVLSHSNQNGDRVLVKSFVNESTQFLKIVYDDSKKAYQLVNSTTNEVLGIDSSHPTHVIIDSNEKQDRQYWKLIDTLNDTIVIENYGSPGKVIEVTTDLVENNRTIELNDLNESSKAQQFQVLIDIEPPTSPNNLNYSDVTDTSVELKWEASTDNVGVSKYEIYNQFGLVGSVDGGTLTYVVESLKSATLYQFTVKAIDGSGNSSLPSNEVGVTTRPKSPVNLKAGELTESSAVLTWESGERPEVVTGYEIYKDGQLVQTVDKDSLTYKVEGLVSATAYKFTVKTKVGSNSSLPSNEVGMTTRPKAPVNLKAGEVTESSAVLTWESGERPEVVTGYEIYKDGQLIQTVDKDSLTYKVEGLVSATAYKFTVKTKVGSNSSLPSNEVGMTTRPKAPVNLKAGEVTESSAVLTWESGERPEVITGYEIYKDGQLIQTVDKDSLTYKVEGLVSARAYKFTVKTKVGSNSSLPSNEVGMTTRPKSPVNLKAGEVTESSAVLTWESGERPEVVTGYEIYKDGQLIQTVDKDSLTYKVEGLESATVYRFTIKTQAGLNNTSIPSNILEIETTLDNSPITINLSDLVPGEQDKGYTFSNNILSFNANSSGREYVVSSKNETNRSIIIDQDIETTLIFNNISIRAEQPITVKNNSDVTFLIQESSENKLVATNGSGIAVNNGAKIVIDGEVEGNNRGTSRIEGSTGNPAVGGALSTISIGSKADLVAVTNNSQAVLSNSNKNSGDGYLVSFEIIGEENRVDPNRVIHVHHEIWTDPSGFPERVLVRDFLAPQLENKIINIAYTTGIDQRYVVMNVTGTRTGDIYDLDNRTYNFNPTKELSPIKSEIAH
ncbi:fibronectin type III domain-containing protein [Carnobacterium maltaromaticum]|uniref:fibronectin type III domain-containing protein n=1 Tax=Carnobacterium maltaromaticum TaxID=2751 RepID=UPI0012FC8FA1|nr:fibronectin type III domain-containing protein [Carnobacterium maltaromaticum]